MDSSRALPNGVVTFLMTDVEGSTRLWERDPEAMRQALQRHDTVVAACIQRYSGYVVKSRGEGNAAARARGDPHRPDRAAHAQRRCCGRARGGERALRNERRAHGVAHV